MGPFHNGHRFTVNQRLKKPWLCIELPMLEYGDAWDLQKKLVAAIREGRIESNVVLVLEHPPVFTTGRRGGLENLTVSLEFLKEEAISVFHVERGGDITYHGPGQLIMYPIMDLRAAKMTVTDCVAKLEEVMIRTAADWGIKAERNLLNRGVWVGDQKLGSLGIAIRHGITFHGFALNVNPSMRPFSWINPCGLQVGITSMERELSKAVSSAKVKKVAKRYFEEVFGVELVMTSLSKLQGIDDGFTETPVVEAASSYGTDIRKSKDAPK
jgi:lipoate-protein ligase B